MGATFDLDAALDGVRHCRSVLVCPHNDPDPDALAAAWGMAELLRHELGAEVTIAFDGIIGRAENRAMVRELGIKLRRLDKLDPADFDGAVLVDTQPTARNHSLPTGIDVIACVDHHGRLERRHDFAWHDVRPNQQTTSSIVLGYLRERAVELAPGLATAILYALKTDTRDFTREASAADLEAHDFVLPRADLRSLGAIVNPRLDTRYFHMLHRMLDAAHLHGAAAEVYLGDLPYPDLVAEMADLLVRRKGTDWCLCGGIFQGDLRYSLRTEDEQAGAGALAVGMVERHGGSAGGHGMTAGGQIPLPDDLEPAAVATLWTGLVREFLDAVEAPAEGAPLCPHPTEELLAAPRADVPEP